MNDDPDIRICMGSSCFSRGNRRNLEVIERYLREHGVDARVSVGGSRCEDHCPEGPNVTLNGVMYHRVDEGTLLDLLKQHFGPRKEG